MRRPHIPRDIVPMPEHLTAERSLRHDGNVTIRGLWNP